MLDQFLPGERAAVHGIIAAVLAQRPDLSTGPSELGYHQAAAGRSAGCPRVVSGCGRARPSGYTPLARPVEYLERVLELWARVPDAAERAGRSRGNVLVGRRRDFGRVGDFDRAVAYATAALAEPEIAGDPERGAELWQRIARYHLQDGNGPPAFAAYQAAATLLDSAPPARGRSRLAADHALALAIWEGMTKRSPRPSGRCGSPPMRVTLPPEVWRSMPPAWRGLQLAGLKTVSETFGKRWIWPVRTALTRTLAAPR